MSAILTTITLAVASLLIVLSFLALMWLKDQVGHRAVIKITARRGRHSRQRARHPGSAAVTKFKDTTRGGYPFTLYTTEAGGDRPVHGSIVIESGEVVVRDWMANGRYRPSGAPHPHDLIPLIPVREPSEAAVEAVRRHLEAARRHFGWGKAATEEAREALLIAYKIDGIGGGE